MIIAVDRADGASRRLNRRLDQRSCPNGMPVAETNKRKSVTADDGSMVDAWVDACRDRLVGTLAPMPARHEPDLLTHKGRLRNRR